MGNVNEPGAAVADGRDDTASEDLAVQNTTNSTLSTLMSSGALSVLKTGWVSSESHTASPDVSLSSANVSLPIPESAIPESFDDGRILLPANSPNRPLKDIAIQSEHVNASEPSVDQDEPLSTYALIVDRLLSPSFGTHPVNDVQGKLMSPSSSGPSIIPVKVATLDNRLSATSVGFKPTPFAPINAARKPSAGFFPYGLAPANDMKLVPAEGMSSATPTSSSVTASEIQNTTYTNDTSTAFSTLSSSIFNAQLTADIPGAQIIPPISIHKPGVDQRTADVLPESSLILSNETLPSTTDSGTTLTDLSSTLPTDDDIVKKVAISGEKDVRCADMVPLNLASQLRHHANSGGDDMATILSQYPELSMVPEFTSYVEATNLAARYPELAHIILSHPLAVKKASVPSDQSKQSPRPNWTLAPLDNDTPKHTASRPNWALAPPDDDTPKQTTARPNRALAPVNPLKAPSRRNYIPLPIEDSPEQSAQVVPAPSSALPPHGLKHIPDRPNWALVSSDQPDLSGNAVDGLKDRPNWALASPASPRQSPVINAFNGPKHTPDRPNWALAGPDPPRQSNPHVNNALDGPEHTPERPNWALAGSDSPRQQRNPDQSERRGRDRERRRGYAGYDAGAMYNDGYRTRAQKFDQQASKTRIGSYDDQRWNISPHSTVHSPWEPSLIQDSWNARNKPDEQNNWNNAFIHDTCPNGETEWFRTDNQFQAPVRVKTQRSRNDPYQLPVDDSRNDLGSRNEWNAERPRNYRDQSYHDIQDRWNAPAPHSDWNITLGSRAEHSSIGYHQQEEPWTASQEWITRTDNQRSGREDAYLRSRESGPDRDVRERPPHDPPGISLQISNAPDVRFASGAPSSRRHDDIRNENAPYGQQWKEPMTSNPKWDPQTLPLEPRSDERNGVTDWGAWTPDQYAAVHDNWKRPPAQNMIATGCREPGNETKSRNWAPEPRLQVLSNDHVWDRPLDGGISDWLGPTPGSTQKFRPVEETVQNEWNAPRQVAKGHVSWNTRLARFSKPQSEASQAFDDIWNRPPGGDLEDWISPIVREDGIPDSSGFPSASKKNSTGGDIKTGEGRDWQDLMDSSWGVTSQSTTATGMNQSLEDPWSLAISVDDWLAPSSHTKQAEMSQPTMGCTSVSIPIDSPLWSTPPPKIDEWAAKQTAIILESNAQAHAVTDTAVNQTKFSVPAEDASLSQNQRGGSAARFTSNAAVENWIIPGSVPTETLVPEARPTHLPIRTRVLDCADSSNASAPYQEVNVLAVPGTGVDQGNGVAAQRSGAAAEQSKQDTIMGENKDMVSKQPEAVTGEKSTFLKGKTTPEGGRQKTGMADASSNWRTRDASPSPKYLPPSARRFYSPKREPSVSRHEREGSPFQIRGAEQSVERPDYSSLFRQSASPAQDVSTISQQGVATVAAMKASELFNKGKENIPALSESIANKLNSAPVSMQPVDSKNVEELVAELKHLNAFSGLAVDVEGPVAQNE